MFMSARNNFYTVFFIVKSRIIGFFYRNILKKIFFLQDPEAIHNRMKIAGNFLGKFKFTRLFTHWLFFYSHPSLRQQVAGIQFENPVGLAAGFDKNAELVDIFPDVGFGHVEIGSITGEPCAGNAKPRLWRLPQSQALVVNYGLYNDGAFAIAERLKRKKFRLPIGVSVAKTNCLETVETEAGIADYVKAYRAFLEIGDYDTINVSCPNAFGGRPFTDPDRLELLLGALRKVPSRKPMFLKISPDVTDETVDRIIDVARKYHVAGFICSNLTKQGREKITDSFVPGTGGISGKVVEEQANHLIRYIYEKTRGEFVIIGLGGIFSAEDAYKKIRLGASLVQLITGMIFEGPQLIGQINFGLVKLLQRDNMNHIGEAVGKDV